MKKQIIITLSALELLIITVVIFYFLISPAQAMNETVYGTSEQGLSEVVVVQGLEKSEFYPVFKKIENIPYTKNLNCKNKSEQFAKFAYEQGYRDIKLLQVWSKDYSKGHQVVLINGFIYDPTCGYYQMEESKFLKIARNGGLDGALIIQDYIVQ